MADDNLDQWYILESMKATTRNSNSENATVNTRSNPSQQQGDWYSLEGVEAIQATDIRTTEVTHDENQHTTPSSTNISSAIDFTISENNKDVLLINTNSLLISNNNSARNSVDADTRSAPSPSNTRLNLQESVDGEISDSRNSSKSTSNTLSSSGVLFVGDCNNTSLLLRQANDQEVFTSMNAENATNYHLEDHEWVNLTSSNIQDVNRPEPLGRTDGITLPTSINQSSLTNTLNSRSASQSSGSLEKIFPPQEKTNKRYTGNESISSSETSKPIGSDIPDLSYTHSSVSFKSVDSQFKHKRVGPAQDVILQNATDAYFSNTSLTSMDSTDRNTTTGGSKISNETPVTKLLGPAYKQTEKFLHDLKNMKLSYKEHSYGQSGPEYTSPKRQHFDVGQLDSTLSSRDESCQAGESKLEYSTIPFSNNTLINNKNELVEQDIASASMLDFEMEHLQQKKDFKQSETSTTTDDQRESEGELMFSELSGSFSNTDKKSLASRSGSSRSHPSSQGTYSSLEPIQEVLSPDRKKISPKEHLSMKHVEQSISTNETLSSKQYSFQTGSINSTSTPHANSNNVPASKHNNIVRGIYDIKDSTSPGSSNRKRIMTGKLPVVTKTTTYHDPSKIYVSDDSKFAASTGSSVLPVYNNSGYVSMHGFKNDTEVSLQQKENLLVTQGIISNSEGEDHVYQNLLIESDTTTSFLSSEDSVLVSVANKSSADESGNNSIIVMKNNRHNTFKSQVETPPPRSKVNYKEYVETYNSSKRRSPLTSTTQLTHETSSGHFIDKTQNENGDGPREDRKEQNTFRSTSLNDLWNSFERSYRDAGREKSPLIKKLEIVSNLLNESRRRSSRIHEISNTSDSTISYCESHMSSSTTNGNTTKDTNTKLKKHTPKQTRNYGEAKLRKSQKENTNIKNSNICPLCQRREIGTNFPTPSALDMDTKDKPLTLQTWSQTSPYIIDTKTRKHSKPSDKENDKNLINSSHKPRLIRKETYTVMTPDKSYSADKGAKRKGKKDIPYTAWFHSIRSDVSEVVPLGNVPSLNSIYSDIQSQKVKNERSEGDNLNSNLQVAFRQHKQQFIQRSKQRVQEVKDSRLQEKHGDRIIRKKIKAKRKPSSWLISTELDKRRISANEKLKQRLSEVSPRNIQRLEEQRISNLRNNRLKMKQYDLKNRKQFLKIRTTVKKSQFLVVRH